MDPVKFLLVDDLRENLLALEAILRREGLELLHAQSGTQALELLLSHEVALAIIDVQMPGMDGFELAELMRGTERTRRVPIIFLTAGGRDDRRQFKGYELGAVDFLFKPVEPQFLLSKADVFHDLYRQRQELARQRDAVRENEERLSLALAALRRREAELRTVCDNSPNIIVRFDRAFRHVYSNVTIERLTGRPADWFLGRSLRELGMSPSLCDPLESAIETVFKTGRPETVRFTYDSPNGLLHLESQLVAEPAMNGSVEHVLALTRDVTTEQQVAKELARAKEAAEAANAAKDRFLAVLSHELRTPLSPVTVALSHWQRHDEALPAELKEDLRMIRRNVELECRLIDDMLDVNRIVRGKIELQLAPIDLHHEIRHAIRTITPDAQARQLQITFEDRARRAEVKGDAARIQQILWNLLKNAVKFTPPGGTVSVHTEDDDSGRIRVRVRDSGVGIDPADLSRIFDAFEQGGSHVTRQFGGLGLGLAISKALAELHGGSLVAHSQGHGHGATFTLELALIPAPEPVKSPAPGLRLPAGRFSGPRPSKLRILLVEDHADTARAMARLLTATGNHVLTAASVNAALAAWNADPYDLIISDLGLPDGSGYDLLRQLSAGRPVRAIALTGYGMEEDIERGRNAGFAAHLTKPVNFEQLFEAINRVIADDPPDTAIRP